MSLKSISKYNAGFLLHIVIESPAFLNFLLFPSGQLGTTTLHAHAVIRQYATLILATILIAYVFLERPIDELGAQVAGALSVYHIAPSLRSASRLSKRMQQRRPLIRSEAFLYLLVHTVCFGALLEHFWTGYLALLFT